MGSFGAKACWPSPRLPRHRLAGLVGAGLLALLMGACASTPADAPPTPTAKPIALATSTPRPTPSPTATPQSACPGPDLASGQHISASGSYTQTETQAAGPMICRIRPASCAYRYLIGDLDPTVVFKQEEDPAYAVEDVLMHPAMYMPLNRLNRLVKAEWGGAVRLRVTDTYDSILEHDLAQSDESRRYSLHFEGRSIDLTTWPIEWSYYGRLCALAHCAGFDWVYHEGDHCHASIKAESLCTRCTD